MITPLTIELQARLWLERFKMGLCTQIRFIQLQRDADRHMKTRFFGGWMKKEMRALSVRQPWAWLIVNGHKDIENRSWSPPEHLIGKRIVIHASQKKLTKDDFEYFLELVKERKIKRHPKSIEDFEYGAYVGTAILEGVSRSSKSFWAGRGNFHWEMAKVQKMTPKRGKGMLGLYRVKV